MIYNDLQPNYNRLRWQLQGFTMNYNPFTIIDIDICIHLQ